ncbi:SMP-30/gluconolactonase/LRE family protein [Mycobacteroides salmoniphilum]|uniref:Strictosidine synthase n=1 Tax=Mycobacteroides salmoniphilum TaxID=404941 RepID=A0A4R8SHK5_9MYCO|nr:SMP-30/gluconolactonase/LRE family protein [Mycobacteroides salmoniphilum]TDZ96397.1 Strictosidine synthase [Mycobacteroides salmoniphilum]TEA05492.1 Strictosidine synthase [Mycobacteroides salmoniphilum]
MNAPAAKRTTGVTVLLWMRTDKPREESMQYWRGPHSQLVARAPGFLEYRQHHFPAHPVGLWPAIAGVETEIPEGRRIDGTPEVTLENALSSLKSLRYNKVVFADEKNVFARTVLNLSLPGGGRWFHTAETGPSGFRAQVLLRRRDGVSTSAVSDLIHDKIGATLAALPGITEVRSQVFVPFQKWLWDTPEVAHDYEPADRFHASIVIGARDEPALRAALDSVQIGAFTEQLQSVFTAIHAYPVIATYVNRRDARPTLPQISPAAKPRLDPVRRHLPPAPIDAAIPSTLPPGRLIPIPGGAAEDVIADRDGKLLVGAASGPIVRYDPQGETTKVVADTRGRPLGLEMLPDGRILVCDSRRGLLRVDPTGGSVETLVQYVDGVPLRFCSNAAVQDDGTVWFTESTNRFDFEDYLGALLEHRPSGRLFRRDPDGTVECIFDDLYFANGLSISPDGSHLFYAETGNYSVSKLALTGAQQGQREPVLENLPGFPDNISKFTADRAWIALSNPRSTALDKLASSPPVVRKLLWRMPERLHPQPETAIWAIAIDPAGTIVDEIRGTRKDFDTAMGALEHDRHLYLASALHPSLLQLRLDLSTPRPSL